MSVTEVQSRMADIQAQLALLSPARSVTGAAFASALASQSAAMSAPSATAGVTGDDIVTEAKKYLGLPYVWGGTDPQKGVDCSGLVQCVYKKFGIDLPRVSNQQAQAGRPVTSMAEAQPGDLIAWDNSSRNNGVDHIAIYIGGGKMIEAPRTGLNVRIVDVPSTPDVIRRVLPEGGMSSASPMTVGSARGVAAGTPYSDLFAAAGAKYGVDPRLLSAVAKQESGYNPKAVSPAGAQGLMQLMPGTARGLGVGNPLDPAQAVDGAARLLKGLLQEFGRTDLALAAYNAGPGAVHRYHGIPPYAETQNYVRSIMGMLGGTA